MKTLFCTLALTAFAALAAPSLVLADEMDPAKMSCKDFAAMDMAGMMKATEAMHMAGPDSAMKMDEAKTEEAMKMTMTHCEGKPDMMAMDAMMKK